MIKFEKDNYIMYFEDADKAAEWVINEYENGGDFEDILEDIYEDFGSWVNDNWTAYDILCEPTHYDFDELWDEWAANFAHGIFTIIILIILLTRIKKNEIFSSNRNNPNG